MESSGHASHNDSTNDTSKSEDSMAELPAKKNKIDADSSSVLASAFPGSFSPSSAIPILGKKSDSNSAAMSVSPDCSGSRNSMSSPISMASQNSGQDQCRTMMSSSPGDLVDTLLVTPLSGDAFVHGGKVLVSSSPIKSGLIFNFSDKQQQILFDLAVLHECNMDKKFLIDPKHEPPKYLLGVLSNKMEDYDWSNLESELAATPPKLEAALALVKEIRQGLQSVLLPWHSRLRQEIEEILDEDFIKQRAENGAFDFAACAGYIVGLMAKLCAPIRDEGIAELKKVEGVVPMFKGIFAMLNHMRIDMINYHLIALRTELLRNGRRFEREKFDELMKFSEDSEVPMTKAWLEGRVGREGFVRAVVDLASGQWTGPAPEVLLLDGERLEEIKADRFALVAVATAVALAGPLDDSSRCRLRDALLVLLRGISSDVAAVRVWPNLAEQVVNMATRAPSRETLVEHLCNLEHPVRSLMSNRIDDALVIGVLSTPTPIDPSSLHTSLNFLAENIATLTSKVAAIVSHTSGVYGDLLFRCISPKPSTSQ